MGAVCVTGAGLDTADLLRHRQPLLHGRPGGTAAEQQQRAADRVARRSRRCRPIRRWSERPSGGSRRTATRSTSARFRKCRDTSLPEAVLRNGMTFNAESVVVLSAAATSMARALELGEHVARVQAARQAVRDRRGRHGGAGSGRAAQGPGGVAGPAGVLRPRRRGGAPRSRRARSTRRSTGRRRIRWRTRIARSSRCPTTRRRTIWPRRTMR